MSPFAWQIALEYQYKPITSESKDAWRVPARGAPDSSLAEYCRWGRGRAGGHAAFTRSAHTRSQQDGQY